MAGNPSQKPRRKVFPVSSEDIERTIGEIDQWYKLGEEIENTLTDGNPHTPKTIVALARVWGMKAIQLTNARLFFQRYDEGNVDELCNQIRRCSSGFRFSHLVILLAAEDTMVRSQLQLECINNGWTNSVLKAAKAKRCKLNSRRGRPPRVSADSLPFQLQKLANGYCRLVDQASCSEVGEPSLLDGLSEEVTRSIKKIYPLMERLRKKLLASFSECQKFDER